LKRRRSEGEAKEKRRRSEGEADLKGRDYLTTENTKETENICLGKNINV
jgi:hypothetical protein